MKSPLSCTASLFFWPRSFVFGSTLFSGMGGATVGAPRARARASRCLLPGAPASFHGRSAAQELRCPPNKTIEQFDPFARRVDPFCWAKPPEPRKSLRVLF
ncbi:hypothetical protein BRADI_1g13373v3 [Brachypodium distachyon]|uniref:Uncharacterized protein n=1 Tax=Brachypodium distachyon TaxID=15368 RepID=A0A0Q3KSA7_BRADI|nr:hypothetical protein BRADI_1g13373v3 [Brachypodium distachyon]